MINDWPRGPSTDVLAARRVIEVLQMRAERQPDTLAYTYLRRGEPLTLSYGQLYDDACRAATRMLQHLQVGDRAILLFGSGLDFVRAFMGCHVAGLVAVPVMPPRDATPGELGRITAIVQDTDARLIVTTGQMAQMGQALLAGSSELKWLSLDGLDQVDKAELVSREQGGELALLQYTSGSTSAPRGVMVSHNNLLDNLGCIYWAKQTDEHTVSLSWLPMSHDMGLIDGVLQPLYSGIPGYLMSPVAFLKQPLLWLEAISQYGATVSGGPNFAYDLVLRRLGTGPLPTLDLSRWRFAYNASETVRPRTIEAFCARMAPLGFKRTAIHPLYGLAEATLGVTDGRVGGAPRYQKRVDGRGERTVVSCGHTDVAMTVAIVDPGTGQRVSPGEEGEIWLSGPSVTGGYWRRPEKTEEVFGARLEGEDLRYLRTGDLGFIVDDELFISGRLKEIILSRGKNVHPPDLEQTAEATSPMLRPGGAAAFRVSGDDEGAALVVELSRRALAAKPEDAELQALAQQIRSAVARVHGVPVDAVILVKPGTIPRTTSGKRKRLRVAEMWRAGELSPLASVSRADTQPAAPKGWVRARVAELLGVEPSALDCSRTLPELGLDSLRALELLAAVEARGGGLPVAALLGLSVDALANSLDHGAPVAESPWFADAQLAEDVQPGAPRVAGPPNRVLVTGATGFLGGHIALELLATTGAQVLCLVRGERAQERLLDALAGHAGWRSAWQDRVEVVCGELSAPGLGLAVEDHERLARGLDAIYHSAAMVNWVYPYAALAPTNVEGTRALLRLACEGATPLVYVSTLACAWSLTAADTVSEDTDPVSHIDGIHLDYVRTKAVAESLVRQAGVRGLQVGVVRPGLIFSNAETGEHSAGDFLSALFRGCIEMGSAPDLDWLLDVCPVDEVARAVVHRAEPGETLHLGASEPRSWRAAVLWMNLRGYPVRLLPYEAWCEQLDAHTRAPDTALRPLRSFFTRPVDGLGGLRMPQLYEESRRNPIDSSRSKAALEGLPRQPLDAAQLERSFAGLVASAYLPASGRSLAPAADAPCPAEFFERSLQAHRGDPGLRVRSARPVAWASGDSGPRHSIVGELASWRFGSAAGISRFELVIDQGQGGTEVLPVVLKAQVAGHAALDIAEEVAALCSEALGQAWKEHGARNEVIRGHLREAALYATPDRRFADHTPIVYGMESGLLLQEDLSGLPLLDAAERPGAWTGPDIEAAIEGLAQLHAIWLGRSVEADWMPPPRDAAALVAQSSLWEAMGEFVLTRPLGRWLGTTGRARYADIRHDLMGWAGRADALPQTLIHNDFSPRNAALRADRRLCVYDWELARMGLPQRDLAEFLCFTLSPDTRAEELEALLELHRAGLEAASGQSLDPADWRVGFGAALADLMVTRLPLYAMIDAFRPQAFLARVVQTWVRIDTLHTGRERA